MQCHTVCAEIARRESHFFLVPCLPCTCHCAKAAKREGPFLEVPCLFVFYVISNLTNFSNLFGLHVVLGAAKVEGWGFNVWGWLLLVLDATRMAWCLRYQWS